MKGTLGIKIDLKNTAVYDIPQKSDGVPTYLHTQGSSLSAGNLQNLPLVAEKLFSIIIIMKYQNTDWKTKLKLIKCGIYRSEGWSITGKSNSMLDILNRRYSVGYSDI